MYSLNFDLMGGKIRRRGEAPTFNIFHMCLKSSCKVNKLETRQRESSLKVAKFMCSNLQHVSKEVFFTFSSLFISQSFNPGVGYPNPLAQLTKSIQNLISSPTY